MRWAVDGDILLYSVGFASQDEPVANAIKSMRSACENVLYDVNAEGIDIYLTGKTNYRNALGCGDYPYKGNRKSDKPIHFVALKEYMIETLGAIVVEGQEADDAMAIAACQHGHGIATLDKDLDGVPGLHYNWRKKEVYYVSPESADRFFYKQLLTGDSTDNIPGLYKRLGKKVMKKVYEPLEEMDNPADMYSYVRKVYEDAYEDVGMCLDDKEVVLDDWLLRQARMLWMRREEGEMWTFPKKSCT